MKFLFITSTNLASNPRLHKELDLAVSLGHNCTVLQFKLGNWSDEKTQLLELNFPSVIFINFSATRKPFFKWLYASLIEKVLSFLPLNVLSLKYLAYSFSKRTLIIVNYLKKYPHKFDWVIAHNPSSFYPAYIHSKSTFSNLGIDIEDYHPGETMKKSSDRRITKIMSIILPHARYCSFASPLIQKEVNKCITNYTNNHFTILNSFNSYEFHPPKNKSTFLKIVWYSQNIDFGRGLELFIDAVQEFDGQIELTLIGDLKNKFKDEFLIQKKYIKIIPPITQMELHNCLSNYDVGLACDIPINRNREIALSNKLISYVQAGLYILATNTLAQKDFLENFKLQYTLVSYDLNEISKNLKLLLVLMKNNKIIIDDQFKIGSTISWEMQNKQLIRSWNQG